MADDMRERMRDAIAQELYERAGFHRPWDQAAPERRERYIARADEVMEALAPILAERALAALERAEVVDENTSDGYHTFAELYEYRMLYNAHAAHGWIAMGIPVVKSTNHHDGEPCFGGGWFIITATLPTGQVSNHYRAEHWDLFCVPEVDKAPEWDGHTPQDAAGRLQRFIEQEERTAPEPIALEKMDEWEELAAELHHRGGDEQEAAEAVRELVEEVKGLRAELDGIKARDEEVGTDEGWHIGGAWGDYGEVVVPLRILSYVVGGELDQKITSTDPGYAVAYAEQVARAGLAEAERDAALARIEKVQELVPDVGVGSDLPLLRASLPGATSQSHAIANAGRAIRRALDGKEEETND